MTNVEHMCSLASEFCQRHIPALFQNSGAFALIAAYIMVSVVLYFISRGKEFIIAGYAGVLFFLPFLKY